MKIRALIVDDEPLARQRIRSLLRDEPDVQVLAECGSGRIALATIRRDSPDLVFLDVQLPGKDGFAVLQAIPRRRRPAVIFTTADAQHALRAFDAHALDYLLKPFKPARFKEALRRARAHVASKQLESGERGPLISSVQRPARKDYLTRLPVKAGDKVVILRTSDIEAIESAGNYVAIHFGKGTHILRETLSGLETVLDPGRFLRISRSAIVNLDHIKEFLPLFRGEHVVVLRNGKQLTMTRGLREVERILRFS